MAVIPVKQLQSPSPRFYVQFQCSVCPFEGTAIGSPFLQCSPVRHGPGHVIGRPVAIAQGGPGQGSLQGGGCLPILGTANRLPSLGTIARCRAGFWPARIVNCDCRRTFWEKVFEEGECEIRAGRLQLAEPNSRNCFAIAFMFKGTKCLH